MSSIDDEILSYYAAGREANRLEKYCQLEEARTRSIISRRLAKGPLSIIDIGGGAGAYSFWLMQLGHIVHLVDPVALHIEQAKAISAESGSPLAGLQLGDAEHLPFDGNRFDVALSLGPLYHLTERSRRVNALRESFRVMRPDGTLFAAGISRYGTLIEGFFKGYAQRKEYADMMLSAMRNGQHRNLGREIGLFTTSYFHRPEELKQELSDAGFVDIEVVAIEGAWTCIPDFASKWADEGFRSQLMEVIEFMEADPTVIGFGGHMMAIAKKPDEGL